MDSNWDQAVIPNAQPFPAALFIGDSVTTGWQAIEKPTQRWTNLLCQALGWREINLGIDGLGFFARRGPALPDGTRAPAVANTELLKAAVRLQSQVIFVSLGLNDAAFLPSHAAQVHKAIWADLEFLRSHSHASVVVCPYFPTLNGSRFNAVNTMIAQACSQLDLIFTDCLTDAIATSAEPARLAIDSMHPATLGHTLMSQAMLDFLAKLAR